MCICINCRHIHNCTTYLVIQKQHKKNSKFTSQSYFVPLDTLVEVNIYQNIDDIKFEWDLTQCLSFVEKPGNWIM
uniref:Conserved hypothetical plastid protein n=1 Tax=Caulacanthus okamurae TaxID=152008 RepID=A0A6H1U7A6_9FLOR|nr:conserved hypothetical plastid protein [Caulacanthus okamurae]QIZ74731.1 conserved hypothetical plastid protein [Caulacanthus okamurae]